jgi:Zn ribbon nucleic-acid-binding protein
MENRELKERICSACGTANTPLWRRNALGNLVCNACGSDKLILGLYQKANNQKRPEYLKKRHAPKEDQPLFFQWNIRQKLPSTLRNVSCTNCLSSDTPLWRRDTANNIICNACGLYFKLHGVHRPIDLKFKRKRQEQENQNLYSNFVDQISPTLTPSEEGFSDQSHRHMPRQDTDFNDSQSLNTLLGVAESQLISHDLQYSPSNKSPQKEESPKTKKMSINNLLS